MKMNIKNEKEYKNENEHSHGHGHGHGYGHGHGHGHGHGQSPLRTVVLSKLPIPSVGIIQQRWMIFCETSAPARCCMVQGCTVQYAYGMAKIYRIGHTATWFARLYQFVQKKRI